jgi:hypothetical protein
MGTWAAGYEQRLIISTGLFLLSSSYSVILAPEYDFGSVCHAVKVYGFQSYGGSFGSP